MFTYCLNNPVNTFDPNGMCSYSVYYGGSVDNNGCYRCKNKPYIHSQEDESIAEKRLGVTTVSHAGCGPVAVYNAAVSLGMDISFDEVLEYYNARVLRMNLLGLVGTPMGIIKDFFEEKGYYVYCAYTVDSIAFASQSANASIIYYKYTNDIAGVPLYGAHFVEYSYMGNKYYAHNVNIGSEFSQINEFTNAGSRFDFVGIFIFEP